MFAPDALSSISESLKARASSGQRLTNVKSYAPGNSFNKGKWVASKVNAPEWVLFLS